MEKRNRREFLIKMGAAATVATALPNTISAKATKPKSETSTSVKPIDNPLVMLDGFFTHFRREYPLKIRLRSAKAVGYSGVEFFEMTPFNKESIQNQLSTARDMDFEHLGVYYLAKGVIDNSANDLPKTLSDLDALFELSRAEKVQYINLAMDGQQELRGESVTKSGMYLAQERHMERAKKIVSHFNQLCKETSIRGQLYNHSFYVADTPLHVVNLLAELNAKYVFPALAIHHWYLNDRTQPLNDILNHKGFKKLPYAMVGDVVKRDGFFKQVSIGEGDIDLAYVLCSLAHHNYKGILGTYGKVIGGDPFKNLSKLPEFIKRLNERYEKHPELWPIE